MFTNAEWYVLVWLLEKFCEQELDQHVHWKIGGAYVDIGLEPPPGAPESAYDVLEEGTKL